MKAQLKYSKKCRQIWRLMTVQLLKCLKSRASTKKWRFSRKSKQKYNDIATNTWHQETKCRDNNKDNKISPLIKSRIFYFKE